MVKTKLFNPINDYVLVLVDEDRCRTKFKLEYNNEIYYIKYNQRGYHYPTFMSKKDNESYFILLDNKLKKFLLVNNPLLDRYSRLLLDHLKDRYKADVSILSRSCIKNYKLFVECFGYIIVSDFYIDRNNRLKCKDLPNHAKLLYPYMLLIMINAKK